MNILKKAKNRISNSKIVKNPIFLSIGLIVVIILIALIYFIFLKYSPIMNFKYGGYAISGKDITKNLLGSSEDSTTNKNIELTKIEEQGTIFKKLNDYFVGSKEKTEINLNYPIYINNNSAIYNLAESSTLISKDFEEIAGYPNLSISEGKVYDGNNLERADAKEYIFVKTSDEIYINLYEIKINTTANEYTIPVNSILAFTENSIRYYTVNNNVLVFNQINDVDSNSNVQMGGNNYTYEDLLIKLRLLQKQVTNTENNESQTNIIKEDTTNSKTEEKQDNEVEQEKIEETETPQEENQNGYIKPEVSVEDFTAEVYTAKSTLTIKDSAGRIVEAPTFEIYKDGKIYLRRTYTNSGNITVTGLVPETEYKIVGKYVYLNENGQKVENTFYEGTFTTKGYDELGSIDIQKENGEIYSNKIQLTKVKITSDINAEVIKGISQVEIVAGDIRTVLKNNQVNELVQGKEITIESSEGLKSDSKINYIIKFYDRNGIELKVNNNTGETRTSKEAPVARVSIKEQDIVSVTLRLNLTNKDNVELENYKYIVTRTNGEKVKEEKLAENEKEILLNDLDQNQYYKIGIYADYDLNDNKGKQENVEIGNLVFATQPISTLGSLELTVENKELTSTTSTISYKIDEDRTDKRLIQILNELTINIKDGENIVETDILTGEEIKNLQQAETKEIKYENLTSNTTYTIEITGDVQLGNTKESIPITYTYKEFTTLKIPAKVEIRNQFVTGNLIDFDVRIEDINNAVLNNKVRMELRNSKNDLIDLQEITTNEDYIRKTYEKLEENQTYKLSFYADQYNEGSTDETYKINYLIQEIEIVTEPGISGSIGLTELSRKATGKNLVDVSSDIKWYVYPTFNTNDYYGKEYNEATKILTLGGHSNARRAVYDLREYAGQEVTMSFKAKAVSGSQTAYIQNSKKDANRTQIQGLTTEWKDFQYTLTVDSTGYLGFYINGGNGIEIKELQIELGNRKTSYEEFKYTLASNYSIILEDRRDEITTNDYYIKVYEDNTLIKTDRYEEIPEENIITNAIKTYETQTGKQYKVELVIKIKDREYVLSELEYDTQETEEIKGIYNKEDYLEIQQRGDYIVLGDVDLTGGSGNQYVFGSSNMRFEGTLNFNGKTVKKDYVNTTAGLFSYIGENGVIENLVLDLSFNNTVEKRYMRGIFEYNYGTIKNIQANVMECNQLSNGDMKVIGMYNNGIVNNFIVDFKESIYFAWGASTIEYNYGTIKNGYIYGKNMQGIMERPSGVSRNAAALVIYNERNATISNVYSLVSVDVNTTTQENVSNLVVNNSNSANVSNVYSVGIGNGYDLNYGPNIRSVNSTNIQNNYYFTDEIFKNTYHTKTTKLALWDTNFQNQLINEDGAFNVDDLVEKGYYPWLNLPECMPQQDYIELPEVKDKDLADILSIEVLEQGTNKVKLRLIVNNPSAEQITQIQLKNINVDILSQEYVEGKSEVVVELHDPVMYVSNYSVQSITTKGAFNAPYTRNFEDGERTIKIDLYREINSIDDWKNINNSPTENYMLMTDLDFANEGSNIRISKTYTGKVNGNNHTIKNIILTSDFLFNDLKGTIENINIQNFKQDKAETAAVYGLIWNATNAVIDNIHMKDVKITINSNVSCNVGALIGNANTGTVIKNCSAINVSIEKASEEAIQTSKIGGLIGSFGGISVENSYVKNINIISKNAVTQYVGGLIGQISLGKVENCYVSEGKISSEKKGLGGLVGYSSTTTSVEISNCYTNIEIRSEDDKIGGILGNDAGTDLNNVSHNFSVGNIYSSKESEDISRAVGNSLEEENNYAYQGQRINGYIVNDELGAKLLSYNELCIQDTYTNIIGLGDAYDYSQVSQGILPKLYDTTGEWLLPNQEDVNIDNNLNLEIGNITFEKLSTDTVNALIEINNPQEVPITGIKIEDMNISIEKNTTRQGITYIELNGVPTRYYDSYRISEIKYEENQSEITKEVNAKINVRFYKDLYDFSDWQSIEKGTYQNYRLANDIDFSGRTDVNKELTMSRFESNGYTLKNINISTNEDYGSLIKEITTTLSGVNFENIEITALSNNYIGVIANSTGKISNVNFNGVTINAPKSNYVGCISYSTGSFYEINLNNITINANTYVGGLVGRQLDNSFANIVGDNIEIDAVGNYTGGIIGYVTQSIVLTNTNIDLTNSNINGKSYIGGLIGYSNCELENGNLKESTVRGNTYVGGLIGRKDYVTNANIQYSTVSDSEIYGTNTYIGGIFGYINQITSYLKVKNTDIIGETVNSKYVGGITGYMPDFTYSYVAVEECNISSQGSYVGGFAGEIGSSGDGLNNSYVKGTTIEGYSYVGGISGQVTEIKNIYSILINANITATNSTAGGIFGYMKNKDMTAAIRIIKFYNINVADSKICAKTNVGGLVGNVEAELFSNGTSKYYYNNYVHVKLESEDEEKVSIGIGGYKIDNTKLINTYSYKYSTINGQYVSENPDTLNEFKYLTSDELKLESTYKNKLGWGSNFIYTSLKNDKYPLVKNITEQTGVDLPNDDDYISNNNVVEQNIETLENTFNYDNKEIQTYSTYSLITAEDGTNATRSSKLYVKDNKLYALPDSFMNANGEMITLVANNIILDNYNGKEYETVLGSDGKIYDLKESIEYPENFVNSDIESIGNNLHSDVKEVEVIYKNGDKINFNYQTGEIISSSEAGATEKTGIFHYLKEKIAEIGNSNSRLSQEIKNKYEESKELQTKLEETPVEEAIEKQNIANAEQGTEGVTTNENNVTNNSLVQNKYISMYNEKTGQYEIYNEEELLDTSKEEVVSENEKIEANNLGEYYASKEEIKNSKTGIVWIAISIIGVGIVLFALRKNLKKKNT